MVPADMRIIQAKDLFISQSALTGESISVEKTPKAVKMVSDFGSLTETSNLAFMGSNVISGIVRLVYSGFLQSQKKLTHRLLGNFRLPMSLI